MFYKRRTSIKLLTSVKIYNAHVWLAKHNSKENCEYTNLHSCSLSLSFCLHLSLSLSLSLPSRPSLSPSLSQSLSLPPPPFPLFLPPQYPITHQRPRRLWSMPVIAGWPQYGAVGHCSSHINASTLSHSNHITDLLNNTTFHIYHGVNRVSRGGS